jgi:acetyl esterase
MQWFWDQYTTDPAARAVLRDEGEAYAAKLRAAGVPVTAVRFQGIIHDFVMVNAMRDTHAARAATAMGGDFLRDALHGKGRDSSHD